MLEVQSPHAAQIFLLISVMYQEIYYKYKFYTMRHLQGILVTVCKFSSHVLDSKNGETVEDVIAI